MRDPYTYPNSLVLINKRGFLNRLELEEFENRMTTLALIDLLSSKKKINSLLDIYQLHYSLFTEVYSWAGEIRTIGIQKEEPILDGLSVIYSNPKNIVSSINTLQSEWAELNWNNLDLKTLKNRLIRFIPALWKIHPFREGNTRSVSIFMILCIRQNGYEVNPDFLQQHAKFFRNALVMASIGEYSEESHLRLFLDELLSSKKTPIFNQLKTINHYDTDQYEYEYHKIVDQE